MKKIIHGAMAVLLAAGLLTGCGKGKEGEELPLSQMDVEKYVTLGDYYHLDVSVEPVEVNQTYLDMLMLDVYSNYITADADGGIVDRAVEAGDIVNIDYVGKLDGEAFSGGTASGDLLLIGSGAFIDGFEDGLIGVMPGETVDLDMAFPDPYDNNPSLAGQPVVFTVTVNFIVSEDMLDEVSPLLAIEGVETADDFRQFAYAYLYETAQEKYQEELRNALIDALVEQCEFHSLPEAMLAESRKTLKQNLQDAARQVGITEDVLVSSYYNGMSVEGFVDFYGTKGVQQNLAFQAIANREGLALSDEELQSLLEEYAAGGGYASVEAFIEDVPKEDFRNYFMSEKVLTFLVEKYQENH